MQKRNSVLYSEVQKLRDISLMGFQNTTDSEKSKYTYLNNLLK